MRVVHLAGSPESEFFCDLSRLYAADALEVIGGAVAYVTPDGRWRFPADLGAEAIAAAEPLAPADGIARLVALDADVLVPQQFCRTGMTAYRALAEVLGIPYVGNRPAVMALGADKAQARAVVAAAGVDVPAGVVVAPGDAVPEDLPLPAVVKPAASDNSEGLALVRERDALAGAVAAAHEHGDALVETYVPAGREVRCGLLERDGELVRLPLEEYPVDDGDHPVRLAADKLGRDDADELRLMAKGEGSSWIVATDDPVCAAVWAAAQRCHRALGCRHYSLFDFRIDPAGVPWFLEAGLYCSFARGSVLATMARAAQIATDDLFSITAQEALR